MALTGHTAKQPLARVLALVALLCAGVLQVQEAGHGHWHALDDSSAQCLLCHNTAEASLPDAVAPQAVAGPVDQPQDLVSPQLRASQRAPFLARGPPVHS